MCGIAGIALRPHQTIKEWQKKALVQALRHRGPDGQGEWTTNTAVLIHTRLSIVDVEHGKQPLLSNNQFATVVNGEIYNDPELRNLNKNYNFLTKSDSECVIPLWEKFHEEYTEKLRGMYAVALVDNGRGVVVLSRDPFGIKPLYYTCTDKGIAFASEPQALLKAGFAKAKIDFSALSTLLQLQFYSGSNTIFQGIKRLAPGENLIIKDGEIIKKLQKPVVNFEKRKIFDVKPALDELDEVLTKSVEVHQRADVPLGLFLSSGIDSSILLKLMQRLGREKRLCAWTARFETNKEPGGVDESKQAALLAKEVGAQHHIFSITQQQVWQYLPQIVNCMDDPAFDYAIIPTWFLAKDASQSVKVILSGEGGDELFAGYGRYRKVSRPFWLGGKKLYSKPIFYNTSLLKFSNAQWRNKIRDMEQKSLNFDLTRLTQAQWLDINTWLPDDLLLKLDRCLMAHGVEGRVPFLDKKVAEFSFRLADTLKINQGKGKWILRKWLEKNFPSAEPFAPKQGFTVPIGLWIEQNALTLAPLVTKQQGIKAIFDTTQILKLFEKASGRKERHMAWNILCYALWHKIYIMGYSPMGSTCELLAA